MQTKYGGPSAPVEERGDCFDACLASVLEVPIEAVCVPHTDDWWERAQDAVAHHGHRILYLGEHTATTEELGEWLGPVFWIAAIETGGGGAPVKHSIVMCGANLAHDPLGRLYTAPSRIYSALVLLPLAFWNGRDRPKADT